MSVFMGIMAVCGILAAVFGIGAGAFVAWKWVENVNRRTANAISIVEDERIGNWALAGRLGDLESRHSKITDGS